MNTNTRNSTQNVDPRSQAIARILRAREIVRARKSEKAARKEAKREEKARRKALRRARAQRKRRVEIVERNSERELVFHGPHTSADFWAITWILLSCFGPILLLASYFLPWLGLPLLLISVTTWLALAYQPLRVTVTKLGYFEVQRFKAFVGRQAQLGFKVDNGRGDERYTFRCSLMWEDHHLWTLSRLSQEDAATVQRFEALIAAQPPQPAHEGAYREAA